MLTPGPFNAAYYEHTFLAQQLGVDLVKGATSVLDDDTLYVRTIDGLERVDVVYRRVDDLFLDPEVVPRRLHDRRARPHPGVALGERGARQRTGDRRGGRQGRLRLRRRT